MADLRILVVDDEPLARENLRLLLDGRPGCRIVGEAADAEAARALMTRHPVDLLLLDVRMPGASGIELAASLDPRRPPVVVFVTAHEEFAVAAFGVRATDYLLKPFDEARLALALERAAERAAEHARPATLAGIDRLAGALRDLTPADDGPDPAPLDGGHLVIRDARGTRRVALDDILWFRSSHNYVRVHTARWWHLLRHPLQRLERDLDPSRFLRVHRTAIVQLAHVRSLRAGTHGDPVLRLVDGTVLTVSRRRHDAIARLRAHLGVVGTR